jgi:hypothetical protein
VKPLESGRVYLRKEKGVSIQTVREIRMWLNREFNNGNLKTSDFTKMIKLLVIAETNLKGELP